jgi:ATP-binding cassette, subfamily F, member 3
MIELTDISLQFTGNYLFKEADYRINSGDKIALVGANGTGKSSLLKIISGELPPESGKINKQNNLNIGYLPQENITSSEAGQTLLNEAKTALIDIIKLKKKEAELTDQLSKLDLNEEEKNDLVHQLGEVHFRLEELDYYSSEARIKKILMGLGFDEQDFNRLTNEFSMGWQMRIALAKLLISQNDILLLDEPSNHLDLDSLQWLIGFLKNYKGALIVVSHDKFFINSVTNKTLEIFNGKIYSYNGDYDAYLKFKEERDKQLINQYNLQQKKIKETERFIERFRYKATKAKQVQSRIKQLEKIELVELPENQSDIIIRFPEPPKSGRLNIELKNVSKSFDDKRIFRNLDLTINRGDKIALVGPNGAGKTTLTKIITGTLNIDAGERIVGHNTIISYYAQDTVDSLDPELDIFETADAVAENKTPGQLRTLLGCFLFNGDEVFKKVGVLSGGEKSRVALAKILLTKSNLIILDEPTNHLDMSSKNILQRALINFSGSLILVSHDIDFLRPVVNKVIEIRKGDVKKFIGGIEYYLSKRLEFVEAENQKLQNEINSSLSKKEQKRIEAGLRQKKYDATKDLIKKISNHEKQISYLEIKVKELEALLADPEIYSDPEKAKKKSQEYKTTKRDLEILIYEWGKLSEELTRIENSFNYSNLNS